MRTDRYPYIVWCDYDFSAFVPDFTRCRGFELYSYDGAAGPSDVGSFDLVNLAEQPSHATVRARLHAELAENWDSKSTGGLFCGAPCTSSQNCSQSVLPGMCVACFPDGFCGGCDCACGGECKYDEQCEGQCSKCFPAVGKAGKCGVGCGGRCTIDEHCLATGCGKCEVGRCRSS